MVLWSRPLDDEAECREPEPFAYITNYLPSEFAARLPAHELQSTPLFTVLKRKLGIETGAARGTVEAALADAHLAQLLRVDAVSPLLVIKRTVLGADLRLISFNVIYAPSSRYRIVMDLRNAPGARGRSGHAHETPARKRGR